jgi:hypothetical protein
MCIIIIQTYNTFNFFFFLQNREYISWYKYLMHHNNITIVQFLKYCWCDLADKSFRFFQFYRNF